MHARRTPNVVLLLYPVLKENGAKNGGGTKGDNFYLESPANHRQTKLRVSSGAQYENKK